MTTRRHCLRAGALTSKHSGAAYLVSTVLFQAVHQSTRVGQPEGHHLEVVSSPLGKKIEKKKPKHVQMFFLKRTSVTLILHLSKCIYSTLMTALMLLMVELSSKLTLWSLLTLSAYRRHMKMMYAGSPGMKLTATPRGLRSDGHERKDFLNVCRENLQSIHLFNSPVTKALSRRPSSPSMYSSMPQ